MYRLQFRSLDEWRNDGIFINIMVAKIRGINLHKNGWNVRIIDDEEKVLFDLPAPRVNKIPVLLPVDLSKANGCKHPDIKSGTSYLACIGGHFYAGTFTYQWYGWNFNAVYGAGFQLNAPGLEGLWEICIQS